MALISPQHLQSVVTLGLFDPQENVKTGEPMRKVATGFLYAYPSLGKQEEGESGLRLWLVTCKHVIQGVYESGSNGIMIRMNRSGDHRMQTFAIPPQEKTRWSFHPTQDIAVIPTSWKDLDSKGVQWQTFAAGRNALPREKVAQLGLSEGYEVFILGFPVGWRRGRHDYPIVRHGILAQTQGWLNREHETFLVDGSGFPGNSGGPVVTKPQNITVAGINTVLEAGLIGMVSKGTIFHISPGNSDLAETADLIEVVPMEAIDESIEIAMQEEG